MSVTRLVTAVGVFAVGSTAAFFTFQYMLPGAAQAELRSHWSGVIATIAMFLVDKLLLAPSTARGEAGGGAAPRAAGIGPVTLIATMMLVNFALRALAQLLIDAQGYSLGEAMQAGDSTHLSVQMAGFIVVLVWVSLLIVAFLLGLAAHRVRYWHFLTSALVPDLFIALPRIIVQDPTAAAVFEDAVGGAFSGRREVFVAIQLTILTAGALLTSVIWWSVALGGQMLRSQLTKEAAPGPALG